MITQQLITVRNPSKVSRRNKGLHSSTLSHIRVDLHIYTKHPTPPPPPPSHLDLPEPNPGEGSFLGAVCTPPRWFSSGLSTSRSELAYPHTASHHAVISSSGCAGLLRSPGQNLTPAKGAPTIVRSSDQNRAHNQTFIFSFILQIPNYIQQMYLFLLSNQVDKNRSTYL